MTSPSKAYEVRYVLVEERSILVFAEDSAKAIEEAKLVHANEAGNGLFEVVSSTTCGWNAEEVMP